MSPNQLEKTTLSVRERGEGVFDISVDPVSSLREVMAAIDNHGPRGDYSFVPNNNGNFALRLRYGTPADEVLKSAGANVVFVDSSLSSTVS